MPVIPTEEHEKFFNETGIDLDGKQTKMRKETKQI